MYGGDGTAGSSHGLSTERSTAKTLTRPGSLVFNGFWQILPVHLESRLPETKGGQRASFRMTKAAGISGLFVFVDLRRPHVRRNSSLDIKRIVSACEAEARKNKWNVTVAILDDGGHLLLLHRMDGASPVTSEIAMEKGRSAAV